MLNRVVYLRISNLTAGVLLLSFIIYLYFYSLERGEFFGKLSTSYLVILLLFLLSLANVYLYFYLLRSKKPKIIVISIMLLYLVLWFAIWASTIWSLIFAFIGIALGFFLLLPADKYYYTALVFFLITSIFSLYIFSSLYKRDYCNRYAVKMSILYNSDVARASSKTTVIGLHGYEEMSCINNFNISSAFQNDTVADIFRFKHDPMVKVFYCIIRKICGNIYF